MESVLEKVKIYCIDNQECQIEKSALISHSKIMHSMMETKPGFSFPSLYLNITHDKVLRLVEIMEDREISFTNLKDAKEMYLLSQMYYIKRLENKCRDFLIENINVDYICYIHDFACEQHDTVMQYYCWIKFDFHWDDLFKSDYFLGCKLTTIERFLSRPKYISLPEVELFKAIYNWVKINYQQKELHAPAMDRDERSPLEQYRSSMEPFLRRIRFLAMSMPELEQFVFNTNLLNDIEIQAIRYYFLTETTEHFPESICSDTKDRTKIDAKDPTLFVYKNRKVIRYQRMVNFTKLKSFACEISVMHDCFLTSIQLPINHRKSTDINVLFKGFINSPENRLHSQYIGCNKKGYVFMEEPIFLEKNCFCYLSVQILESEITKQNAIMIIQSAEAYMKEEETARFEHRKSAHPWNMIYFDVHLYF